MSDTTINLGGFQFRDLEIPSQINFGGDHKLVVHELVGGQRIIDAMGRMDTNISWEGLITGPDSIDRALQLENFRTSGQTVSLTWFNLSFNVVVEKFIAYTEKYYQVKYQIECKTVNSGNDPFGLLSLLGFDQSIANDLAVANGIASIINIPSINNTMSSLTSAISSVPTFNGATPQTISSVMTPLNAAQSSVSSQIATVASRLFGS
jgi:hypothetical protein